MSGVNEVRFKRFNPIQLNTTFDMSDYTYDCFELILLHQLSKTFTLLSDCLFTNKTNSSSFVCCNQTQVLAVYLMAAKLGVPVCPHAGGVGLCNMVPHLQVQHHLLHVPHPPHPPHLHHLHHIQRQHHP